MTKKKHNNEILNPTHDVSVDDYLAAKAELDALRKQYGLEPKEKEKGLSRLISSFFAWRENREKVSVSKKKLLWLAVLTGWCGGHRFYSRRYVLGALYLLFFWSGVPTAMTIIDLLEIIPIPPDETGNILV